MLWQGQSEEVVAQMNASGESRLWSQLSRKQQQLVCKIGFWQVMFFFWGGDKFYKISFAFIASWWFGMLPMIPGNTP